MNRCIVTPFCLLILITANASADDGAWGHLHGRFTYDGPVPKPATIRITKDAAVLGTSTTDESLLVNPANLGLANVVIYLLPKRGEELPVHASYDRTANAKVQLVLKDARITPHMLLVRTSQTIVQLQKDKVAHSVIIQTFKNPPSGQLARPGDSVERRFTEEERLPCPVTCAIHPWMRGHVLIRSNPYMAKTDVDGRFTIKNLPVGQHEFRIWHERIGWVRNVQLGALATDKRGRLTVDIKTGDNKIKVGRLAAKMFAAKKSK